jgi:hypothetical protein
MTPRARFRVHHLVDEGGVRVRRLPLKLQVILLRFVAQDQNQFILHIGQHGRREYVA